MLTVPDEVKALFRSDGVRKNFRVHFPNGEAPDITNDQIVLDTVKFKESVCSRDVFVFGETEASRIEFEAVGISNVLGKTIECSIEAETTSLTAGEISAIQADPGDGAIVTAEDSAIGYGYYSIPLGVFVVESCPRSKKSMMNRRVVAYSPDFFDQNDINDFLYEKKPFPEITLTIGALLGWASPDTLTETTVNVSTSIDTSIASPTLYDASGAKYVLHATVANRRYTSFYGKQTGRPSEDFIRAEFTTDEQKIEAYGKAIAKALTDANYSLIYNSRKEKIYKNNEEALRAVAPYLFGINGRYVIEESGTSQTGDVDCPVRLKSGQLKPLVLSQNYGVSSASRVLKWADYEFIRFDFFDAPDTFRCTLSSRSSGSAVFTQVLTGLDPWATTISSFKKYSCAQEDLKITVGATLKTSANFIGGVNAAGTEWLQSQRLVGYTYANAFSYDQALDGVLELTGRFGRHGRDGKLEVVALTDDDPVTLDPNEYEDCWFDEYNVAPIGKVIYSFGNPEAEVEYEFGEGESEYDMRGNYFLSKLKYSTLDVSDDTSKISKQAKQLKKAIDLINGVIDSYFVPAVEDLAFTPVDLQAIGLPYVQPGDYYTITTGDGTTVTTYMLSREMDGVHVLFDNIESEGGEILSEGVRSL